MTDTNLQAPQDLLSARAIVAQALVARVLLDAGDNDELQELWGEYPDIGKDDWDAIVELAVGTVKAYSQADDQFTAAYELLAARAEDGPDG